MLWATHHHFDAMLHGTPTTAALLFNDMFHNSTTKEDVDVHDDPRVQVDEHDMDKKADAIAAACMARNKEMGKKAAACTGIGQGADQAAAAASSSPPPPLTLPLPLPPPPPLTLAVRRASPLKLTEQLTVCRRLLAASCAPPPRS